MTAPFGEHAAGWDPHYDDGLTRERTLLAWHRTSLAFVVNAGLIANGFRGLYALAPLGYSISAVVLALAAFTYLTGGFRFDHRFWHKRVGQPRDRSFRIVSLGSSALASAAVTLILLT